MDQHATLVLRLATTHLSYRFNSWPFFLIFWYFADGDIENIAHKVESNASLVKINVKSNLNKVLLGGAMKVEEKLVCRLYHILQENSQLFLTWRISILHT